MNGMSDELHPTSQVESDSENESRSNKNQAAIGGTPRSQRGGRRRGAGRKPIKFDLLVVEKLSSMGCSNAEMAGILRCSVRTVEVQSKKGAFARARNYGRASIKINLRRWLLKTAEKGNAAVLI